MAYLVRGGSLDLTVPAAQSIAVGSYQSGQAAIYLQSLPGNAPQQWYLKQYLLAGTVTLGPFSQAQNVRLFASNACELEYAVGTSPQLSGGGAGAVSQSVTLLNNATATGAWFDWNGSGGTQGTVTITCSNWNAANATLQYSIDGGVTPLAAGQYCSWSANGSGNFRLPTCKLRIAISGAVPGAGVNAVASS